MLPLLILTLTAVPSVETRTPTPKKRYRVLTPRALCRKYRLRSRYCTIPRLPPYGKIQALVRRHWQREQRGLRSLKLRLRRAAYLPNFGLEFGLWNNLDTSLTARPGQEFYQNEEAGSRQFFRIQVKWEPRRLIFDPNEIMIFRERRRERALLDARLQRGRRLYFKWKKELILYSARPSLRRLLLLEELEATLSTLCGAALGRVLT